MHYKLGINNTNVDALNRIHDTTRGGTRAEEKSTDTTESQVKMEITENSEIQFSSGNLIQNEENLDKLTYKKYLKCKESEKISTPNVSEVYGDLFEIEDNVHFAHCVSKYLEKSKGIALQFRRKFGKIEQLQLQQKQVMEVAHIKQDNIFIFILLLKKIIGKNLLMNIYSKHY